MVLWDLRDETIKRNAALQPHPSSEAWWWQHNLRKGGREIGVQEFGIAPSSVSRRPRHGLELLKTCEGAGCSVHWRGSGVRLKASASKCASAKWPPMDWGQVGGGMGGELRGRLLPALTRMEASHLANSLHVDQLGTDVPHTHTQEQHTHKNNKHF